MSEIWFGTKGYMQWITAPAVDVPATKSGFATGGGFLGGGAWVRRSKTSAKRFTFSWNMKNRDQIQPILDYADGIYGNGFLYYCNPFVMGRNALPSYWASPAMNYYDGPLVVDGVRPELVVNNDTANGYPLESAVYTVTSTSNVPSIFIPMPPGYRLHIGAHGSVISGNATVTATPEISAVSSGTRTNLVLMSRSNAQRTNRIYEPTDGLIGVTLSLASTSTGRIQLDGLMAQLVPAGTPISSGPFYSGLGQSGMEFVDQPSVSEYSAALDRVGVSAELVETEAWRWR